jgi:hypothetical protein
MRDRNIVARPFIALPVSTTSTTPFLDRLCDGDHTRRAVTSLRRHCHSLQARLYHTLNACSVGRMDACMHACMHACMRGQHNHLSLGTCATLCALLIEGGAGAVG